MARVRIAVTDQVPEQVMGYATERYEVKKPTVGELDDGSVLFYILHEFGDREYGCDVILRLFFPEKAGGGMV
jgi:hypothetical protein